MVPRSLISQVQILVPLDHSHIDTLAIPMTIICSICLEELKVPVSVPCGHIFCTECLMKTVEAVRPYNQIHHCPTCRTQFVVSLPNPTMAPSHLLPYLSPNIRRIYIEDRPGDSIIDSTSRSPHTTIDLEISSDSTAKVETDRLRAENTALRTNCAMWRKRAELHGATNLGFLELSKTAKLVAVKCRQERDDIQRKYDTLKKRVGLDDSLIYHEPDADRASLYDAGRSSQQQDSNELDYPNKRRRR